MRVFAMMCVCAGVGAEVANGAITNGGFEPGGGPASSLVPGNSTAVPGWLTTDTGVEWFQPGAFGLSSSPNGGYVIDLANYTYSAGGIRQTLITTPGEVYDVVFSFGTHIASGRDGTAEITVSAGATSQNFSMAVGTANITWLTKTFTFAADAASTTLAFRCTQNALTHFAYIDGVGASVAPAPGAAGIVAMGLACVGRRRRRG